jgi:hypothetical protein
MLKLDILLVREEPYIPLRDSTRACIAFVSSTISNIRVLGLAGYTLIEEGC